MSSNNELLLLLSTIFDWLIEWMNKILKFKMKIVERKKNWKSLMNHQRMKNEKTGAKLLVGTWNFVILFQNKKTNSRKNPLKILVVVVDKLHFFSIQKIFFPIDSFDWEREKKPQKTLCHNNNNGDNYNNNFLPLGRGVCVCVCDMYRTIFSTSYPPNEWKKNWFNNLTLLLQLVPKKSQEKKKLLPPLK